MLSLSCTKKIRDPILSYNTQAVPSPITSFFKKRPALFSTFEKTTARQFPCIHFNSCTICRRHLPLALLLDPSKMRYQNWYVLKQSFTYFERFFGVLTLVQRDVLLFPSESMVPLQEFKTACQTIRDPGEFKWLTHYERFTFCRPFSTYISPSSNR